MADTVIPEDLHYSTQDEWARSAGGRVTVGITDYAQQQLGDIVFVELPAVGATLTRDAAFGVIESVKAVSDLYAPISGEVLAVNDRFLRRIQNRYPRIASRVFLNLTRILSDRLQRMNEQFIARAVIPGS